MYREKVENRRGTEWGWFVLVGDAAFEIHRDRARWGEKLWR